MNKRVYDQIRKINVKKSFVHAIGIAIINIGSPCVLAVLSWNILFFYPLVGSIFTLLTIIFVGTRYRAINNMSHECIHRSYCDNPHLNEFFGEFFAMLEFSTFKDIRREHQSHHLFLGDFSKDMDFHNLEVYGFCRPLNKEIIKEHLFRAISLSHLPNYVFFIAFDRNAPVWANFMRAFYLGFLFLMLATFSIPTLLFLVLPYLTVYQMHKYLADVLDHSGIILNLSEIYKTRNFVLENWFLRFLFFPRHDCYHLIHHLFPGLAVEQFKKVHAILLKEPNYFSLKHKAQEHISFWMNSNGEFKIDSN